jgi:hypothetical protein
VAETSCLLENQKSEDINEGGGWTRHPRDTGLRPVLVLSGCEVSSTSNAAGTGRRPVLRGSV